MGHIPVTTKNDTKVPIKGQKGQKRQKGLKGHKIVSICVFFVLYVPIFVLFVLFVLFVRVLFAFYWTRDKKDSDTPPSILQSVIMWSSGVLAEILMLPTFSFLSRYLQIDTLKDRRLWATLRLASVVSKSFEQVIFPSAFKTARVVPVYKNRPRIIVQYHSYRLRYAINSYLG